MLLEEVVLHVRHIFDLEIIYMSTYQDKRKGFFTVHLPVVYALHTLISLSTQYEREPLYFYFSNVSH